MGISTRLVIHEFLFLFYNVFCLYKFNFPGTLLLMFPESNLTEALKALRSWLRNAKGRKC